MTKRFTLIEKQAIGDRLRKFAEENFKHHADLAKALEMKPQSLQSYFNGKSVPGGELLSKLIDLGCNVHWLLHGDDLYVGEPEPVFRRSEPRYDFSGSNKKNIKLTGNKKKEFKILGRIPAGNSDFHDWSDHPETKDLQYDPDEHFFLEVDDEFGYSMMPLVNPGDLILVSMHAKIKNGDLVAARWDETKGALKIYTENPDFQDTVVLTSYNQAIAPIFVKRENVQMYKVVLIEKRK